MRECVCKPLLNGEIESYTEVHQNFTIRKEKEGNLLQYLYYY